MVMHLVNYWEDVTYGVRIRETSKNKNCSRLKICDRLHCNDKTATESIIDRMIKEKITTENLDLFLEGLNYNIA